MAQLARLAGSKTRNGTRTEKLNAATRNSRISRAGKSNRFFRTFFVRTDNKFLQIIIAIVLQNT